MLRAVGVGVPEGQQRGAQLRQDEVHDHAREVRVQLRAGDRAFGRRPERRLQLTTVVADVERRVEQHVATLRSLRVLEQRRAGAPGAGDHGAAARLRDILRQRAPQQHVAAAPPAQRLQCALVAAVQRSGGVDRGRVKAVAGDAVMGGQCPGRDRRRVAARHRRKQRVAVRDADASAGERIEVGRELRADEVRTQPVPHHHEGATARRHRPGGGGGAQRFTPAIWV